jgi:hypothetical protein
MNGIPTYEEWLAQNPNKKDNQRSLELYAQDCQKIMEWNESARSFNRGQEKPLDSEILDL